MTDPADSSAEPATPPADDQTADLDELMAEVQAENPPPAESRLASLPPGTVLVPLRDVELAVLHPVKWPGSATEFMLQNRLFAWGRKAIATVDDRRIWDELDPTLEEMTTFLHDAMTAAGVPLDGYASPMLSVGMRDG